MLLTKAFILILRYCDFRMKNRLKISIFSSWLAPDPHKNISNHTTTAGDRKILFLICLLDSELFIVSFVETWNLAEQKIEIWLVENLKSIGLKLANLCGWGKMYATWNLSSRRLAMKNEAYKHRVIDGIVVQYLTAFGAVCIEGPKWCGKHGLPATIVIASIW